MEGWGTPSPVFWKKRLQSIENKWCEPQKDRQESSRGAKPLRAEGLGEVEEVKEFGTGVMTEADESETAGW